MELAELKELIRAKRDALIISGLVLVLLLLVVIGYRMQKNYSNGKQPAEGGEVVERVTISSSQGSAGSGGQETGGEGSGGTSTAAGDGSTTYFLKPSADEVLELIRETGQAQLPTESQEYTGFRVMWPCFYFGIQKLEGSRATVMFDISEDGFGATIVTDIDTQSYPEVTGLEPGKKVWLAGEIIGIDPTGTGTIHLIAEELRFEEGLLEAIGEDGVGRPAAASDR